VLAPIQQFRITLKNLPFVFERSFGTDFEASVIEFCSTLTKIAWSGLTQGKTGQLLKLGGVPQRFVMD
jgi:hypothetical protein